MNAASKELSYHFDIENYMDQHQSRRVKQLSGRCK